MTTKRSPVCATLGPGLNSGRCDSYRLSPLYRLMPPELMVTTRFVQADQRDSR